MVKFIEDQDYEAIRAKHLDSTPFVDQHYRAMNPFITQKISLSHCEVMEKLIIAVII